MHFLGELQLCLKSFSYYIYIYIWYANSKKMGLLRLLAPGSRSTYFASYMCWLLLGIQQSNDDAGQGII